MSSKLSLLHRTTSQGMIRLDESETFWVKMRLAAPKLDLPPLQKEQKRPHKSILTLGSVWEPNDKGTPTKGLGSFSRLVFNARRSSRMIKMCTCMGKSCFLWLSFPLVYFLVIKHCFYNQTGQALNGFVLDYIIICLNMCFY